MARITGGEGKGRHLVNAPRSRPTAGRAREALFSILAADLPGSRFCDAFAGGGSIGIEALSRGAAAALFIEISHRSVTTIQENLSRIGFQHHERDHWHDSEKRDAVTMHGDFFKLSRRECPIGAIDIWFLDPPWSNIQFPFIHDALSDSNWLASNGIVILEHPTRLNLPDPVGHTLIDRRRYGDTSFSMWQRSVQP